MLFRLRDYTLIFLGALIQALSMVLFYIPGKLAAGGVTGTAQIIVNYFPGIPIGLLVLGLNIPLFVLGWRFLGGRRFLIRTVVATVAYTTLLDVLTAYLPKEGVTHDPVLNALYGAVIGGIGVGLVFRAQATSGGTDILARLLGQWRGIPVSQSYLITDAAVVFVAGLAFGWDLALYALVTLYVSGLATEATLEGAGIVRTATIITSHSRAVSEKILSDMERGVTMWPGTGMYSGEERQILFVAVTRSELSQLKALIHEADPSAFVVIGQAHEALGEGFKPLKQ